MLFSLILRNVFSRPTRSLLTILGISIGIAAIVTLVTVTEGMMASFGEFLKTGSADFMVGQANAGDLIVSAISEERVNGIRHMDGVEEAIGICMGTIQYGSNPFFLMFGIKREDFEIAEISVVEGEAFQKDSEDELILGKLAAVNFEKGVGDGIEVGGKGFTIKGIFETGNVMQDSGSFAPLGTVQKLFLKEGQVSIVFVKVTHDADITEVCQRIEDTYPNELVTIKSMDEVSKVDQGPKMMDALSWAISLLAVIVGGFGVMNTMIMSVSERTREIGVLRAVGWRRSRVLRLILGETLLLSLGGFAVGSLLGIAGVYGITSIPMMSTFMRATFSSSAFLTALMVAVLLALVGGFYPAYKASRLSPVEALRYE